MYYEVVSTQLCLEILSRQFKEKSGHFDKDDSQKVKKIFTKSSKQLSSFDMLSKKEKDEDVLTNFQKASMGGGEEIS